MVVAAVIQARMGSSRLPGKVLLPLAGRPVLWHVVHRLRQCRTVNLIAVATSTNAGDDPLAAFAAAAGIACVRGPEDDVLARYLLAADVLAADVVVRVTGDAPLLDPAMLDAMVEALEREGAEWANVRPGEPCIHEGFDPVTAAALRRLAAEAGGDPVAREHVTGYFRQHPGFARTAWVPVEPECRYGGARLSVDTPADLRFLEEVYRRLGVPPGEADVRAVARELRADPALAAINSHVHQKLACERSRSAVLRCDGDARIGMGHVTRSLAIAAELRDAHAWGVVFAVASGDAAVDAIRRAGFGVERARGGDEAAWLEAVLAARAPDALVLDVRTALSRDVVARWRARGVVTVVVDDASDRRLAAGLAFFPPVPQVRRLDWTGFTGRLLAGWEWVPLRRSFADPPSRDEGRGTRVLVTMGGSDPAGLTARALAALDLVAAELTVDVVVGAAFRGAEALASRLESFRHPATVHRDVADPAPLMRGATLAIAALGVTAYELAACGAPSLLLSLTDDHAESASAFAEAGIALSLGVHTAVTDAAIARGVEVLLADATRRAAMGACARSVVDGRGAARIAAEIAAEAAGR